MKNQALFPSKDKSKKLKCHLLQFSFGAFMVKLPQYSVLLQYSSCCCCCCVVVLHMW